MITIIKNSKISPPEPESILEIILGMIFGSLLFGFGGAFIEGIFGGILSLWNNRIM